jgi:hypothetical protein
LSTQQFAVPGLKPQTPLHGVKYKLVLCCYFKNHFATLTSYFNCRLAAGMTSLINEFRRCKFVFATTLPDHDLEAMRIVFPRVSNQIKSQIHGRNVYINGFCVSFSYIVIALLIVLYGTKKANFN